MPPGSDAVVQTALVSGWEAGMIAFISLFWVGLLGWAFVFAIRRIYGNGGYKERALAAEERVANRQVNFIDTMQNMQTHRDDLCTRHAAAIEHVGVAMREQSEHLGKFAHVMTDSDGVLGIGQRLETSATELADIAVMLFDRPWCDLTEEERTKVKDRIETVRKRHARNRKE